MSQKVARSSLRRHGRRTRSCWTATHDGKAVYACSTGCHGYSWRTRQEFAPTPHNPRTSTIDGRGPSIPVPGAPEARSRTIPGTSPKCDMTLEPLAMSGHNQSGILLPLHPRIIRDRPAAPRFVAWPWNLAPSPRGRSEPGTGGHESPLLGRAPLSLPIFLLAMGDMLPGKPLHHLLSMTAMNWVQLALATPVVFWCGRPFFERAWLP